MVVVVATPLHSVPCNNNVDFKSCRGELIWLASCSEASFKPKLLQQQSTRSPLFLPNHEYKPNQSHHHLVNDPNHQQTAHQLEHIHINGDNPLMVQGGHQQHIHTRLSCEFDSLRHLCKHGHVDDAIGLLMHSKDVNRLLPREFYPSLLNACNSAKLLPSVKIVHAHLALDGLESTILVSNYLVSTLVNCGALVRALELSYTLSHRTIFTYNALIRGLCNDRRGHEALEFFECMQDDGIEPDALTFTHLLKWCGSSLDLENGEALHAHAQENGLDVDVFVGSTLISMYGKCGRLEEAENVFVGLPHKTTVAWNAMMSAYIEEGEGEVALQLYSSMEEGARDARTFAIAFQACSKIAESDDSVHVKGRCIKETSLKLCQALHADSRAKNLSPTVFMESSLVNLYSKCGSLVEAENVFAELSNHDVVSWTAMLAAYMDEYEGAKSLQAFVRMQEQGVNPNARTYVVLIQACCQYADKEEATLLNGQLIKVVSLRIGQALHDDCRNKACDSDDFVRSSLVIMYGKCGNLAEAEDVFLGLSQQPEVVTWNAMLSAYVDAGEAEKALRHYGHMQEKGPCPTERTLVVALQACCILALKEESASMHRNSSKCQALQVGRAIHADAQKTSLASDIFVGNSLVSFYGRCHCILEAENVFQNLQSHDIVSWNVLLSAYIVQDDPEKCLGLYRQLQKEDVTANAMTYAAALQACSMLAEIEEVPGGVYSPSKGMLLDICYALHADAARHGWDCGSSHLGSTLLIAYGKFGSMADIGSVCRRMTQLDVFSWSVVLSAYVDQGQHEKALQVYGYMQQQGVSPDEWTFSKCLHACCMLAEREAAVMVDGLLTKNVSLEIGEALHTDIKKMGASSDVRVGNSLVSLYGKCGSIVQAKDVFYAMPQRNVASWALMMSGYIEQGMAEDALHVYRQMEHELVHPDDQMLVLALQVCCMLAGKEEAVEVAGKPMKLTSLDIGRALHAEARRQDAHLNTFVGSSLVTMYGRCGSIAEAENVMRAFFVHDVAAWTAMLSVYAEHYEAEKALLLYKQLLALGISPNERTYTAALQACCAHGEREADTSRLTRESFLEIGRALHVDAERAGLLCDPHVMGTLISMYAKCGTIAEGENVLCSSSFCDTRSLSILLSVYVKHGEDEKALELYRKMHAHDVAQDETTLLCAIQACSGLGDLNSCREVHFAGTSLGTDSSLLITNTIIHAYGQCASMADAQAVFDELQEPDVVSWTALIAGYARDGNCAMMSLRKFKDMKSARVKPDSVTLLAILSACSHAGLVDEGMEYFVSMGADYGIAPEMDHFACLVDLLGRAGDFERLEHVLSGAPVQSNLLFWLCLLNMCQRHGNVELGRWTFDHAVQRWPQHPEAYVLMANIYAEVGLPDLANKIYAAPTSLCLDG